MLTRRSLMSGALALGLALVMPNASEAADKILSSGTMDGTFLRLDQGDYAHFVIKDNAGKEQDFFVIKGDSTIDAIVAAPAKYKGRKVSVKWQVVMTDIPEAGGQTKIRKLVSIKLK